MNVQFPNGVAITLRETVVFWTETKAQDMAVYKGVVPTVDAAGICHIITKDRERGEVFDESHKGTRVSYKNIKLDLAEAMKEIEDFMKSSPCSGWRISDRQ